MEKENACTKSKTSGATEFYAGIGSRQTPILIQRLMEEISIVLEGRGYILRSGAAPGADSAFERRVSNKEIYLPWKGFNGSTSDLVVGESLEAYNISSKNHPNWDSCSSAAHKLLTRNAFQILGRDLLTPSEFVICWTKDGKDTGGTGTAIRIARKFLVKIYNLYNRPELEEVLRMTGLVEFWEKLVKDY